MKLKAYNKNKRFPFVVIDDWYTEKEKECVMKELRYLTADKSLLIDTSKDSATASEEDGTRKAKSLRRYINKDDNYSFINRYTQKLLDIDLQKQIKEIIPDAVNFCNTNSNAQFINYYEDGDHYKPHTDVAVFSILIFMYEEPKSFEGGSLHIGGKKIECKNNRLVFFPSYYEHGVDKVGMKKEREGFGRYSISSFYYIGD